MIVMMMMTEELVLLVCLAGFLAVEVVVVAANTIDGDVMDWAMIEDCKFISNGYKPEQRDGPEIDARKLLTR